LGDYAALGPDPAGVIDRLAALPQVRAVRGNTDRFVAGGGDGVPGTKPEEVQHDLNRIQRAIHLTAGMAWTAGALAARGQLAWLEALPLDFRLELPDGTRALAVHASPGADDGSGIKRRMSDA